MDSSPRSRDYLAAVGRALDYIEGSLAHPLKLDEIADAAHMSRY